MSYKILLPVANNPELVQAKIRELDLEKLILVNNFDNSEVESLCCLAEDKGAEVHRYPRNLGVGASWNIGLRKVVEEDLEFIIILSVSARFEKPIEYFVEAIRKAEAARPIGTRYVASSAAKLHCFAHTKRGVESGGYLDENLWPAYVEDQDFSRRSELNEVMRAGGRSLNLQGVVSSHGKSIALRDRRLFKLFQSNNPRQRAYYKRKWGGEWRQEKFLTPFNNPARGLNDWTLEPGVGVWPPGLYEKRG